MVEFSGNWKDTLKGVLTPKEQRAKNHPIVKQQERVERMEKALFILSNITNLTGYCAIREITSKELKETR